MAANRASTANGPGAAPERSYYEQQRELLVTEIAQVTLVLSIHGFYLCITPTH